jgi:AraC-like DNA-binding protein
MTVPASACIPVRRIFAPRPNIDRQRLWNAYRIGISTATPSAINQASLDQKIIRDDPYALTFQTLSKDEATRAVVGAGPRAGASMIVVGHGPAKFPTSRLLASSAGRHWHGILAEHRSHPAGDQATHVPVYTEISILIRGRATVTRQVGRVRQRTDAARGAIWLSPAGLSEDFVNIEFIEANLESDISIEDIASAASLSRSLFARAFKSATGKSPRQYVSERRLSVAKLFLMQGGKPILEVAFACNFSSQANFTKAFRGATGMTPSQYRKLFRA